MQEDIDDCGYDVQAEQDAIALYRQMREGERQREMLELIRGQSPPYLFEVYTDMDTHAMSLIGYHMQTMVRVLLPGNIVDELVERGGHHSMIVTVKALPDVGWAKWRADELVGFERVDASADPRPLLEMD